MFRKIFILSAAILALMGTVNGFAGSTDRLSASFHGVMIADNEIKSNTYDEAISELDELLKSKLSKYVNVSIDDVSYQFTASELGIDFDTYKTAERVYEVNQRFGFMKQLYKKNVDPVVFVDETVLIESLSEYLPGIKGVKDARVEYKDGKFYVSSHMDGTMINVASFVSDVADSVLVDESEDVLLEYDIDDALYTTSEAKGDAEAMSKLYGTVLNLVYSNQFETFTYNLTVIPDWFSVKEGRSVVDESFLSSYLSENVAKDFDVEKEDAVIKELPTVENTSALVEGFARDGIRIDVDASIDLIEKAILAGKSTVFLKVVEEKGEVLNETGVDLGDLELLSVGRSNFAGSSAGRVANIKFGLEDKFNNVLLSPSGVFSAILNSGREVSTRTGWSMAKVILGGQVVNGVGGGLCQCSTTVYRAALYSGMDILFRQQHTVYVSYYSEYGDGLDAAIFNAEGLDFKFQNNTPSYIFIQSYVDGDDAYVNFYGTDDGREVEMLGPFYGQHNSSPHELLPNLRYNQIGWVRVITHADGSVEEEAIVSSYKGMPKK
jgi:vancomycin resistance protein YoaR